MKKKTKWKIAGAIALILVIALTIGCFWYLSDYYRADDQALKALQSSDTVEVSSISQGYFFDGPGQEDAMIFYPGGKVETSAYAPLMADLAAGGLDCFLVEMPFHLAVLGVDKAQTILEEYQESYTSWYMGGHSLGGAMAASFAAKHLDELDGLALLGAYPTAPLKKEGFQVIAIYGSEDGVMNRQKFEDSQKYLPDDAIVVELAGANHAQFGSYGLQAKDGIASISAEKQQQETTRAILEAFDIKP